MFEFLSAVSRHEFLRNALIIAALSSVACGIVGTYVVARRITYVAGGISHSVLGGIGLAHYLIVVHGMSFLNPMHGGIAAAIASALIIGWVSLKAKEREDTVIGAIWAVGMSVGVIFIVETPGYGQDLMSYLFGNILMVTPSDIKLVAGLDALIVLVVVLLYRQLEAVCFDEEFARVRGLNVERYYLLLLCLTALTVVLLVTVVGIVMVIALMTLPAAIAGFFARDLRQSMIISSVAAMILTVVGLAISYSPDLPPGATIVLLAGAVYLVVSIWSSRVGLRRS